MASVKDHPATKPISQPRSWVLATIGIGLCVAVESFVLVTRGRFGEIITEFEMAGITLPNVASEEFHRRFGFTPIGVFPSVGFKFEKWHDVAWFYRRVEPVRIGWNGSDNELHEES